MFYESAKAVCGKNWDRVDSNLSLISVKRLTGCIQRWIKRVMRYPVKGQRYAVNIIGKIPEREDIVGHERRMLISSRFTLRGDASSYIAVLSNCRHCWLNSQLEHRSSLLDTMQ